KFFRHGECVRWILTDDTEKTIGRVAAFINRKLANKEEQPTGGMGFFECINDPTAAFVLFDACKNWLQQRNMEAMDGPINFGDRDRWWGLLTEGFDREPNYCMFFHFPYYKDLFESYGFKDYFRQLTFNRHTMDPLSPKLWEKADRIWKNPDYTFEYIRKKQLPKFAEDFSIIYNKAWTKHKVGEISPKAALLTMNTLKPVMDEKIIWFAYHKGVPVGFFIMLPELNQIFKHVNGKMDVRGKLIFLWHQWRKSCKKMFGLIFGIVPEHQGKGLEGAIIGMAAKESVQLEQNRQYDEFEMNWVGDFNPRMLHVAEEVGGSVSKVHTTYRKLFDESKPFKRHPLVK
ncbi:MAG: hypothetical protein H7Y04_09365, partial [Verrucomicrobia bacterium]|nr:hypothetical protein [Cytophagales bacterium]